MNKPTFSKTNSQTPDKVLKLLQFFRRTDSGSIVFNSGFSKINYTKKILLEKTSIDETAEVVL